MMCEIRLRCKINLVHVLWGVVNNLPCIQNRYFCYAFTLNNFPFKSICNCNNSRKHNKITDFRLKLNLRKIMTKLSSTSCSSIAKELHVLRIRRDIIIVQKIQSKVQLLLFLINSNDRWIHNFSSFYFL